MLKNHAILMRLAWVLEVGQDYLKKKTKKQFALKPTVML